MNCAWRDNFEGSWHGECVCSASDLYGEPLEWSNDDITDGRFQTSCVHWIWVADDRGGTLGMLDADKFAEWAEWFLQFCRQMEKQGYPKMSKSDSDGLLSLNLHIQMALVHMENTEQ